MFPYILIGVGIGAIIHNWIPESWVAGILGSNNPFGVILATIVGIPMYADVFGTIPIAESLLAKGAQLGTVLAFMMGVTTLSLPSMIMLRKAVKSKLLGIFIAICTVGIIIKVLGAGCKSCHEQHENVKKAVANMKLDAEVEYITDMEKVMSYGVMSMPAIVVNEQVVSFQSKLGINLKKNPHYFDKDALFSELVKVNEW